MAIEGTFPAEKSRTATVQIVHVSPEIWIAPDSGGEVYRAIGEEREKAMYVDEMRTSERDRALPVGLTRDGEPVWVDVDFFDGTKGAHMSISGVSGVATKTSYALFFLRCLTSHPEILGRSARNLRVLIFNVKGEDLLFLDKPNNQFNDEASEMWRRLGMEPGPFPSVSFWAPTQEEGIPKTSRADGRHQRLPLDAARVRRRPTAVVSVHRHSGHGQQLTFVAERVIRQLERFARDVDGVPGAIVLRDPQSEVGDTTNPVVPHGGERVIKDLHDLIDGIGEFLEPEDGDEGDSHGPAGLPAGPSPPSCGGCADLSVESDGWLGPENRAVSTGRSKQ